MVNGTLTNFTCRADDTVFITGPVTVVGNLVLEGGSVIKLTNSPSAGFSASNIVCKTGPYRVAMLTSWRDDSAGEVIQGSNGSPTNFSAGVYLTETGTSCTNRLQYLRVLYAGTGLAIRAREGVWHSQFVNCGQALSLTTSGTLGLHNVLFSNCDMGVASGAATIAGEHITMDSGEFNYNPDDIVRLTNSVLASIQIAGNYLLDNTTENGTPISLFEAVGAAQRYLKASAREAGRTEIPGDLLSDLRSKTTYPPTALGFATYSYTNVVFSPRVPRDSAAPPDRGFHYDPIDYVVCGLYASNSLLTVSPGTVIACYGSNSLTYGLGIGPGAKLVCSGSPTNPVRLVAFNTVQEQSVSAWKKPSYALVTDAFGFGARPSDFSFAKFASLGRDIPYVSGGFNPMGFSHCTFSSGNLYLYVAQPALTNCLLERVEAMIDSLESSGAPPVLQNNLFWGGTLGFCPARNDSVLANNLFDGTMIMDWVAPNTYLGGFNAFVTNQARLLPAQSTDIILPSSPQYQAGPLGSYYLPATSTLINAGTNLTADQVGLYHFTVCTNLLNGKPVPETNSWVDIGLHYLALDSSGNPLDADSGGVPDFIEDWSGNGNCETNRESDWRPGHSDDDYAYLLSPQYLRVEYRENPWGVDAKDPWTGKQKPRFFWTVASQRRGARQLAYSVKVASSPENLASGVYDVWNGPQVFSDDTIQVEYDGATLQSGQRLWWKVKTWDLHTGLGKWSTNAFFQMGLLDPTNDWAGAKWIGVHGYRTQNPCPMFRSQVFVLSNLVANATVYVSAKGVYELWINGLRVGPNILAPEWTDYNRRIQYQTFDVTTNLISGTSTSSNVIGAFVGEGWCFGPTDYENYYGPKKPQFLLMLTITNSDLSVSRICTDSDWICSTNGLIRNADLFNGEKHDANQEGFDANWTTASYTPQSFTAVVTNYMVYPSNLFAQPNDPIRVIECIRPVGKWNTATNSGLVTTVFDMGQNMAGTCTLSLTGLNSMTGQTIRLRHAEVLELDSSNNGAHATNRNIWRGNLGSASQEDNFILNADLDQQFQPKFTYHGFRYVEVQSPESIAARLTENSLTGRVTHSSVPFTGAFCCSGSNPTDTNADWVLSNRLINKLMTNACWSLRGNLQGTFTACTQRDERDGYLFDEHIFSQTACYSADMASFFTKWTRDMRDAQAVRFARIQDRGYANVAPWDENPIMKHQLQPAIAYTDPGCQAAGLIIPWRVYQNYADIRILAEHYGSATDHFRSLTNRCLLPGGSWSTSAWQGIPVTDWQEGDHFKWFGDATPHPADWAIVPPGASVAYATWGTAWSAHAADTLALMSRVLQVEARSRGDSGLASEYQGNHNYYVGMAATIRKAYTNDLVKYGDGWRIIGFKLPNQVVSTSQGDCMSALYFNMVPDTQRAHIINILLGGAWGISNYNSYCSGNSRSSNHVSTGYFFAPHELLELTRNGLTTNAYQLLVDTNFPSWLHSVVLGATTCWESWNTYLAGTATGGRGYRNTFWSFNHLPFGAVGEWVWKVVAGVNPDDNNPGFKNVIIKPEPGAGITNVFSSFNSVHGPVVCSWTNDTLSSVFRLNVKVPANGAASIYLPCTNNLGSITESGSPVTNVQGVLHFYVTKPPNFTKGATVFEVGSGTYSFAITND